MGISTGSHVAVRKQAGGWGRHSRISISIASARGRILVEPVNTFTNLAFTAAGLWGVYEVRRHAAGTFAEVLTWWVVAIGIGSAISILATSLTIWFDILPIAGFTLVYTLFNLRRFAGMPWPRAITISPWWFYIIVGAITALVPAGCARRPTARRDTCRRSWR